jgi:hypothetical protein
LAARDIDVIPFRVFGVTWQSDEPISIGMSLKSSRERFLLGLGFRGHDQVFGTVGQFSTLDQFLDGSAQFGKTFLGKVQLPGNHPWFDGAIIGGPDVLKQLLLQVCDIHEIVTAFLRQIAGMATDQSDLRQARL